MNKNQIIIGGVAIIGTFALLFGVYKLTNQQKQTSFPEVSKISADDHTKWAKKGKNVLVEYSDLQCPACQNFHDVIKTLEKNDKEVQEAMKNITFVYRHYPLTNIHKNAENAAKAAEAAGRQGKFFEMVDKIFANREKWENSDKTSELFIGYAKELKLKEDQFKTDINSAGVLEEINKDMASANSAQVSSTPSFFLNGTKVTVASFDEFKKLLVDTAKNNK